MRLSQVTSAMKASKLYAGLLEAIESVSQMPKRCPLARENEYFSQEIRQLIYGRGRNSYRILFTILEQQEVSNGGFGKGRGLVHRDLKPSNIFLGNVNSKLTVKIGDYGLAKAFDLAGLSGQTLTGTQAGTPVFMCRQQLLNYKYVQPEVDVWAAAACLYFMLTGNFPRNFTDGDPFLAVLQNDPVHIRQRDTSIPKRLAEVIDLALVEKPEIYFKSATEFKQALLNLF